MYQKIPKTIAIDYGTKRIGLAVSHASLAEPLQIVANDAHVFENLLEIFEEQGAQQLVVGLSENTMAEKTRDFVAQLREHTELPIDFADETLSSKRVHELLRQRGIKHSKRFGPIDHYAAALILEEWLEAR